MNTTNLNISNTNIDKGYKFLSTLNRNFNYKQKKPNFDSLQFYMNNDEVVFRERDKNIFESSILKNNHE